MSKYIPPTSEEMREFLQNNKISEEEAAHLGGVSEQQIRDHLLDVHPIPLLAWFNLSTHLER